ncbi:MAG: hypothetical protein CVU79_04640 [Elusimicrobia bacterium HGW-Elusimicrobia-3]|nr:MAG: hypothetical protein CVU79_04640 [Elusimicrobia bacterium HGW-Elusimicrobia-3]
MKRPAFLTILGSCALLAGAAHATKLDLSSNVEIRAANYQNLVYGDGRNSQSLFSENATLGFVIKDIKLEKTQGSSMDVGIVLPARLPNANGTPYVRNAYVKIYNFMRPSVTATFGRQDYRLGQAITLSGGDTGLPGGLLEIENVYRRVKADLFAFRPFKTDRYYSVLGGSLYYPAAEGLWQVYHFWQKDSGAGQDMIFNTLGRTKKFTGVRYFLSQSQLSFDGEAVVQRGSADLAGGGSGKYEAHAFMLKGAWKQSVPFFGQSHLRLGYGRSSGNPGSASDTDKAFFPTFGSKNSGLERRGYGAIAGATIYDMIKTSDTLNGLPHGVSGLNVINIGADLPYKKLTLSADLYKFRASKNANDGSLQIASEWDLKASYPMGDNLRLNAVYAVFTPLGLYPSGSQAKLIYGAISAKF